MFAKEFISPKNVYCLKIKLKQLPRVCILLRNLWNFTKKSTFSMTKMKMSLHSLLNGKRCRNK